MGARAAAIQNIDFLIAGKVSIRKRHDNAGRGSFQFPTLEGKVAMDCAPDLFAPQILHPLG
jgi:hypothetical protein